MKKGILELLVLTVLSQQECYGYEIISLIKENGLEISEGALYPILAKLVSENLVYTHLEESPQGGARKYYKLNDAGIKKLAILTGDWNALSETLHNLKALKRE